MSIARMREELQSCTNDKLCTTVKGSSIVTIDDVIKNVKVIKTVEDDFEKVALLPLFDTPEGPMLQITKDNTTHLVNVGFVASEKYIDIYKSMEAQESDTPTNGAIYLPIMGSHYTTPIGDTTTGKFTADEGSPFRIYGLQNLQECMPLCYAIIQGEEWIKRGLYINKDNKVTHYNFSNIKDQIIADHVWPTLHGGRYEY